VDYYILQLNLTWHHERPSHSYDPLVLLKWSYWTLQSSKFG
jgi:hypothetical protein